MNQTKTVRGIDRIVGEMLTAVPDVDEFLRDLECIQACVEKDLHDLQTARQTERMALLSLKANLTLLNDRLGRGRQDWRSRRDEIVAGAADVAVVVPQLGFRVIKDLPDDVA